MMGRIVKTALGFMLFALSFACRATGDGHEAGDTDADEDTGVDGDSDADSDADVDVDGDADGDADTDTDTDTDVDGDLDRDVDHDDDIAVGCPDDMVLITELGNVCIDRYEASRGAGGVALSVAAAMPWVEVWLQQARAACDAAGKRVCEEREWIAACEGPDGDAYPYGAEYDPDRCNGFEHGVVEPVPTGSMIGCEGGYPGLFDMSGNVAEWSTTCPEDPYCRFHGGSFARSFVSCRSGVDARVSHGLAEVGFRCCLSI